MARERTYFKQISLFRARCIYVAHKTERGSARPPRTYIPLRCSWRGLASSFWGRESFEFKRFKAISQEGGASDCRPSNTDRPTTRSFLPLALSPSRLIPFRLLSLLSPVPAVTYCDLLTELCAALPEKRLSLSARKISGNVKNGADGQQHVSQYVSFHVP